MASNNLPYRVDLNDEPDYVLSLAIIPPKEVVLVPPCVNLEQAFYAQAIHRSAIATPPTRRLLGDKPR